MTFEQQWDAARYNTWYWVSYAFMIAVPIAGAVLVAIRFRRRVVRRTLNLCLAAGCLVVVTGAAMLSIEEKWASRWQAARTESERGEVAMRDTGNRAFAPVIGVGSGAVAVLLTYATALFVGRVVPTRDKGL